MWTVLLVEDEVFVRESIKELIEWEEFGFTVIGEAGNGKEALEIIKQKEPDLVITDILMPIMNGVDLLKNARKIGIDSLFVMLSCLNDFEYVRQAMEYGASNYILKLSMKVSTLSETLEKINIDLIKLKGSYTKEIDKQYENLWNLIKYNKKISDFDYFTIEPFRILKNYKLLVFAIVHGKSSFDEADFWNLKLIDYDQESVIHIFTKAGQTSIFLWTNKKPIINHTAKRKLKYNVVYSNLVQANKLGPIWQKQLRKLDSIWHNKELANNFEGFDPSIQWKLEKNILIAFEEQNREKLIATLDFMWKVEEERLITMALAKEIATRLDGLISTMICKKLNDNFSYNFYLNQKDLKDVVNTRFLSYFDQREKEIGILSQHPEINKILKYIRQNYNNELSVKSLAKRVSMDENYLSSLFKKETGETLINYIHKVRIEKAKSDLIETNLSVSQISERVGFLNNNYFIKIFKRITSETPKNFRVKYSEYSKISSINK